MKGMSNLIFILRIKSNIFDFSKGKDTVLKDVDTDIEANEPRWRYTNRFKRLKHRRPRSETKNSESQGEEVSNNENVPQRNYRRRKFFHRRKVPRQQEKPSENGDTVSFL